MRDEMAGDVAAEMQLDVIERLLALMPRSRGFRVSSERVEVAVVGAALLTYYCGAP